ncbi:MAG: QueT transporter family protein [Oscillospiraceae bacterium]|nr:QueT transporter family protein [Oscillospiraceae bacterium]
MRPETNRYFRYVLHIVRGGLIAAIYVAVCLLLQPLSYGAVQIRVSEALTLLPILTPDAVFGVTLGCLLSNLLSFSPIDMLFGTLATLVAALATRRLAKVRLKGLPLASALPPILINAVVVGAEITFFFTPEAASAGLLLFNMLTVGAGQVVSCLILGVPLVTFIEKNAALKKIFTS